jgi:hypothetical protein
MVSRFAAGVVAGLFALAASPVVAQVKVERKPDQADAIKRLEAELDRLRAVEAELQAKLKMLSAESERERRLEKLELKRTELRDADLLKLAQRETEKARKESIEQSRLALIEAEKTLKVRDAVLAREEFEKAARLQDEQLKRARIEFEKTLTLKAGDDKPRVVTLEVELKDQDKPKVLVLSSGDKQPVPYEKMSPQELKQVIVKLQTLLDEKMRNAENPSGEKVKPAYPGKPGGEKIKPGAEKVKPAASSQDEILKRLDKLSYEVEELKRAIKK